MAALALSTTVRNDSDTESALMQPTFLPRKYDIVTLQDILDQLQRNFSLHLDRIGIWKCWFLWRGENWSTRRKTSQSREENQQQTQPTYDIEWGNRTRGHIGGRRVLSPLRQPCSPKGDALAYYKESKFDAKKKLHVMYKGQPPADTGGVTHQFYT